MGCGVLETRRERVLQRGMVLLRRVYLMKAGYWNLLLIQNTIHMLVYCVDTDAFQLNDWCIVRRPGICNSQCSQFWTRWRIRGVVESTPRADHQKSSSLPPNLISLPLAEPQWHAHLPVAVAGSMQSNPPLLSNLPPRPPKRGNILSFPIRNPQLRTLILP